jgi:U3 small nucleolar RNA-associated protein 12
MTFSLDGTRLASGGTEGEIVIWDRIAEVGLFRLKSHRGPITGLRFIPSRDGGAGWLISVAKDGWMKIWDLATQHCVQTVVVGRGECLAMDIYEEKGEVADDGEESEGRWVVLTGGGDGEGKVWELRKEDLDKGLTTSNGEVRHNARYAVTNS